jgi:hypothetical protein
MEKNLNQAEQNAPQEFIDHRDNNIALNFIQMDHRILSRPADVERYFDSLTVIRDGSGERGCLCHSSLSFL